MSEKDRVTILIVGVTGAGKSSLGNVLLGKNHRRGPFTVGGSTASVTKKIQVEKSNAFAGKEGRRIRVVDVPGHGDFETKDEGLEENIVKKLTELEKVDGIIVVYNFSNPRLSQQDVYLFQSLCKVFGPGIMNHIIVNASRYEHSESAEEKRQEEGRSLENFIEEIKKFLTKGLCEDSPLTGPVLTIDALYRQRDRRQTEKFKEETDRLWQHLQGVHIDGGLLTLEYIERRKREIENQLKKERQSAKEKEALYEELKRLREAIKKQTVVSSIQWVALAALLGLAVLSTGGLGGVAVATAAGAGEAAAGGAVFSAIVPQAMEFVSAMLPGVIALSSGILNRSQTRLSLDL